MQVSGVHNHDGLEKRLPLLLPDADIAVGHGALSFVLSISLETE